MINYTDSQLRQALIDTAALESINLDIEIGATYVTVFEVVDLRRILDHLPEPQDDWQECTFEEICTGDQIKTRRRGVTSVYEHPVASTYRSGSSERYVYLERGGFHLSGDTTLYRIPAPAQHPDPEKHPTILVRTYWDGRMLNDRHFSPAVVAIWDGLVYRSHEREFNAQDITDWTPAKVVAEDD